MEKTKTIYTWIIVTIVGFSIIGSLTTIGGQLLNLLIGSDKFVIGSLITGIIGLVVYGYYFNVLFNVKEKLIMWTHFFFGFLLIDLVAKALIGHGVNSSTDPLGMAFRPIFGPIDLSLIGITILIWLTFYFHLKNAKNTNKMDFSN